MNFTHKLAVSAFLFHEDRFLFLLRSTEPRVWAPPGGHLHVNESPEKGIIRELKEETGLDVQVVAPLFTWFGYWKKNRVLSIDYYLKLVRGKIQLSNEHSDHKWVSLVELRAGNPIRLDPCLDLKVSDFEKAYELIKKLS